MSLEMIVTIKQVPDTANITTEAMKSDGTVNRSALPAILNPEDLNALEAALRLKESVGGSVTVLSMGPPSAAHALMECYYRGADDLILLSDKAFAGSDTLATSLILSAAIKKIGVFDLILCGRQAIDGDTGQVGPQLAEKLNINQITYVSEIIDFENGKIKVRRASDSGYEILKSTLPLLLTVDADANHPRPPNVKRIMAYKNIEFSDVDPLFTIWNRKRLGIGEELCGFAGSPTKVKEIENVVLTAHDIKKIPATADGINGLIHELRKDHIIG